MNSENNNRLSEFEAFADERLNNHLLELSTRYGGENVETEGLLKDGYAEHRKIFAEELEEEKNKLAGPSNPWLGSELDKIKGSYLERLHEHR